MRGEATTVASMTGSTLTLAVPKPFDLPRAVCSYGYYMLAPNQWDATNQALHTVLRDASAAKVTCTIDQPGGRDAPKVRLQCDRQLSRADARCVKQQVSRMLRLDEDFAAWRRLHPEAWRARFDRLFRSATLFEDVVKTMTGCNVTWPNTIRMNAYLCEHVGQGAFPTSAQLASVEPDWLKRQCKVGYRAQRIVDLARDVESGRLDLAVFEGSDAATDDLAKALQSIHGIGAYAAANLCQLLGRYDRLAIDSETYRHFREVHGMATPDTPAAVKRLHAKIDRHYARYAPYAFLAYWFELWTGYERQRGSPPQWPRRMTEATK